MEKAMTKGGVIIGMVSRDSRNLEANRSVRANRKARGSAMTTEMAVVRDARVRVFSVT